MGQHYWKTWWPLCAGNIADITDGYTKHLIVKKDQRVQCLILSGCGDITLHSQPSEELLDLLRTHFLRVTNTMKSDVVANPVPVRLLSTNTVTVKANHPPDLITQLKVGACCGRDRLSLPKLNIYTVLLKALNREVKRLHSVSLDDELRCSLVRICVSIALRANWRYTDVTNIDTAEFQRLPVSF